MSRDKDEYVSLADRSISANAVNPDAFVSVHINAAEAVGAIGIETYFYANDDRPLADDLQSKLISYTGAVNRQVKNEAFYVLKNTNVPSALVELGFLTNKEEAENLKNPAYQEKLINANVDGIVGYLNKNVSLGNNLIPSTRISGDNRFLTSFKLFEEGWTSSDYAVIVYGLDYPDALCATPLAAKYDAPILLAENRKLTEQKALIDILRQKAVKNVFIIGGTGIIPSSFEKDLHDLGISSKRLGGANRYETNKAIFDKFKPYINLEELFMASGLNFPDALSGSALAAKNSSFVVLTALNSPAKATMELIAGNRSKISKVYVLGGNTIVKDSTLNKLGIR